MNRWGLMSALALAAALLLMGCRETEKQTDMAEEHPITYEDVCERNTISALLERDLRLIGAVVITQPVVASAACEQQRGGKCEGTH